MSDLVLTIAIFIAVHMVPAIAPLRRAIISTIGKAPYMVGFSMMSLGLIGWVGIAYARAPYIELWFAPTWLMWLPAFVMPIACILLVAVFTNPNPLSVALKSDGYDPAHPGVVSITRHPLLAALLLWSGSHLIVNGDVAALLLFGLFTIMSLLGPFGVEARKKRKLGDGEWNRLSAPTSIIPFLTILQGRSRLDIGGLGGPTTVLGLGLYAGLFLAHPYVIGVLPHP